VQGKAERGGGRVEFLGQTAELELRAWAMSWSMGRGEGGSVEIGTASERVTARPRATRNSKRIVAGTITNQDYGLQLRHVSKRRLRHDCGAKWKRRGCEGRRRGGGGGGV
jgi:hypothetical protein